MNGDMDSVASRISARLIELGISASRAATLAGLPAARVRDILNGKSVNPRADTLAALAPVLETTVSWLAAHDGIEHDPQPLPVRAKPGSFQRLPVRYRVEAGPWHEVEDLDQAYGEHDVPVPPRFAGFAQWLEEVVGDSMDRLIQPGRLIHVIDAIDMGYQPADGDIVVVQRQRAGLHERTLKQVEITGRKTLLWPRSTNPRWQSPLDVSSGLREEASEITVQVVGLVIADFRVWK